MILDEIVGERSDLTVRNISNARRFVKRFVRLSMRRGRTQTGSIGVLRHRPREESDESSPDCLPLQRSEIHHPRGAREYAARNMLTARERRVLDFERSWWKLPGPKDRDIHEQLGFSATLYYRVLREALDKPDALAYDPLTVRRLRRVRASMAPQNVEDTDHAEI